MSRVNTVDVLAGNGPKEIDIREVIEREGTEDRVALGKQLCHTQGFELRAFLSRGFCESR
jgi:hypothetical protein